LFCCWLRVRPRADAPADFDGKIRPLLDTYCVKCHGGEKVKSDVDLGKFKDVVSIQRDPKFAKDPAGDDSAAQPV
jgi:hypothetical protein